MKQNRSHSRKQQRKGSPKGLVVIRKTPATDRRRVGADVFVAMPFTAGLRDCWTFGVRLAAHSAGLSCMRLDQQAFTGDIPARIKQRIECAALVIADLTGSNPNVFLEVGYAWGVRRPTILVRRKSKAPLPFDVRTQKCIFYQDVTDLNEQLTKELRGVLAGRRSKSRTRSAA